LDAAGRAVPTAGGADLTAYATLDVKCRLEALGRELIEFNGVHATAALFVSVAYHLIAETEDSVAARAFVIARAVKGD
jgi:hypothetical protein